MKFEDIGLSISPLAHPYIAQYIAQLQAMEIAELRRKNEEQIASTMGVPAELLFNPLVQSLISGLLFPNKLKPFTFPPSPRRAARRAHRKGMKRR
jgi:hypothetical protein